MKRRGRTRFLLVDSILLTGLPFGLLFIAVLFDRDRPPVEMALSLLFAGLFVGYLYSLTWWAAKWASTKKHGGQEGPGAENLREGTVPQSGRWQHLDRKLGPAIEVAIVLLTLASFAGIQWTEQIVLWTRGARTADKTGLLAYWSFDDCTAEDNFAHRFTGTIHHARCVDGVSGKALQLSKSDGYLIFPKISDSLWKEMSYTVCRRQDGGSGGQTGWHALAVTSSYSTRKLQTYIDGALFEVEDLPARGHFSRGDWEFGRSMNTRSQQMRYAGGAVDEMRVFSRDLSPHEILQLSRVCLKREG